MSFCKNCGGYISNLTNKCYCVEFKIYNEDLFGDDPKVIWARSEEHAIEKLADAHYWDDPCDPSSFEFCGIIDGKKYSVTAEAVVNFNVEEV